MFMFMDMWDNLEMSFMPNWKMREWFYVTSALSEKKLC